MSEVHTCDGILVTCMDFRLQKYIEDWANQNLGEKNYDRIAWAGGVLNLDGVLNQIEVSTRLHHIKKVVLVNHENCGGYGAAGTFEKHKADLENAKQKVLSLYPNVSVDTYYLHLDGNFERV